MITYENFLLQFLRVFNFKGLMYLKTKYAFWHDASQLIIIIHHQQFIFFFRYLKRLWPTCGLQETQNVGEQIHLSYINATFKISKLIIQGWPQSEKYTHISHAFSKSQSPRKAVWKHHQLSFGIRFGHNWVVGRV